MALACKYCILTRGLSGSEIGSLPKTEEELFQHLETEHHVPVRRDGETVEQCMERFQKENPEAGGPNCKCPTCRGRKTEWLIAMSLPITANGGSHEPEN